MFLEILDKHGPLQQKKIKSKKAPWITGDIKTLLYEILGHYFKLKEAWKKFKLTGEKE